MKIYELLIQFGSVSVQRAETNGFMMPYVQQFQPDYKYLDTTTSQQQGKIIYYHWHLSTDEFRK